MIYRCDFHDDESAYRDAVEREAERRIDIEQEAAMVVTRVATVRAGGSDYLCTIAIRDYDRTSARLIEVDGDDPRNMPSAKLEAITEAALADLQEIVDSGFIEPDYAE